MTHTTHYNQMYTILSQVHYLYLFALLEWNNFLHIFCFVFKPTYANKNIKD